MTFDLGYGTNGFANHRLDDALAVIADLGYTGVALTLDHHHLDPFAGNIGGQIDRLAARLDQLGLRVVVETGARYLLDPRHKHHPTLVSDAQEVRVDFLLRAVRIAAALGADCVSFWSGIRPSTVEPEDAWARLRSGVDAVLHGAAEHGVRLGLEPEPGMLVERLADALRLRDELGSPELLGITLDVGHCVAVEPVDAAACVREAGDLLVNVQLDDMLPGVHEHLEFGDGELDLTATLAALAEVGYRGLAAVELPRHSHAAPEVARRAIDALRAALPAPDHPWLVAAERSVRSAPDSIRVLFPAAGRHVGRAVDDVARTRLLVAYAAAVEAEELGRELTALYRHGDDAERRGVLHALSEVGGLAPVAGVEIVKDALRANDTSLVAAALGPFAADHLDQHSWRHGVLKCLFTSIPLAAVAGLDRRVDGELLRMVDAFAEERRAAGRAVPDDAVDLLRSQS
ncbi:Sugar phosphate isomerase/epimerase [Actinokineospora alba]|uniref:Sugar phosphate isomerase/epimerase n=1 Tax=Actinokineospora alba TaxID=504798 RepID=A0A1H0NNL9_9PSEU|nr:EboA domain-containing protein [Actinokineospora alba]TDP68784.1 sugar phosphate isomerase/epimerase [Actinokineospora alba]SDH86597.1 Sugar phosphate isomerase/epimerase [Actinokineospora alba]SDO94241.1 Sugar phosphate isomerase/epimerase [Actinokineospora alba]